MKASAKPGLTRALWVGSIGSCQSVQGSSKEKNVPEDKRGTFGFGDVWTWIAMDADTKLIPTDGNRVYIEAVEDAFGSEIDYAMLIKVYGAEPGSETRHSPAILPGSTRPSG